MYTVGAVDRGAFSDPTVSLDTLAMRTGPPTTSNDACGVASRPPVQLSIRPRPIPDSQKFPNPENFEIAKFRVRELKILSRKKFSQNVSDDAPSHFGGALAPGNGL